MTAEGGMAFGYYKEGAHNPTFAYISKALEAEKVRVLRFCVRARTQRRQDLALAL